MRSDVRRYPEEQAVARLPDPVRRRRRRRAGLRPLHGQGRLERHAPAEHASSVVELAAATPAAEARLWAYLLSLDLIATIKAGDRPVDDVLPWLLVDGRHAKQTSCCDMLWLRPLDVPSAARRRGRYTDIGTRRVRGRRPARARRRALRARGVARPARRARRRASRPTDAPDQGRSARRAWAIVRLDVLHRAGWLDEHAQRRRGRRGRRCSPSAVAPWCNTWF